jgi:hypothetical protein
LSETGTAPVTPTPIAPAPVTKPGFVIAPIEFITKNSLGYIQGSVIQRICNYDRTDGNGITDLQHIIDDITYLIGLNQSGGHHEKNT